MFLLGFTNFNIYFCKLIRFIQTLITIFVKELRKLFTQQTQKPNIMTHFQTISGLTAKNIKLIALEVSDLEVSVYDTHFDTYLSVRVQNLLFSTKLDISYVARKCYFLMYNKKVN